MLIALAVVIAALFGIAGTFISIEARRATERQNGGRDVAGDSVQDVDVDFRERVTSDQLPDGRLSN